MARLLKSLGGFKVVPDVVRDMDGLWKRFAGAGTGAGWVG